MYLVRPFPGRVNPAGEKEFGGVYCWFASANEKFTRDYGGGKMYFKVWVSFDPSKNTKLNVHLVEVSRTPPNAYVYETGFSPQSQPLQTNGETKQWLYQQAAEKFSSPQPAADFLRRIAPLFEAQLN